MSPIAKSLLVFVGAGLGANARYWISIWLTTSKPSAFPWATLLVNLTGAALIGAFLGFALNSDPPQHWRILIGAGLLGGYTTFSAFSLEVLTLLDARAHLTAAVYVAASVVGGIALCWLGYALSK